jgi:hypothetical protein
MKTNLLKVAKGLAVAMIAAAAVGLAGCAGGYYQAGYGPGYYAPDYGSYYGDYGYGGGPYFGYGGVYGGTDIVIGGVHHHGYYGYHHFAGEHGPHHVPTAPHPAFHGHPSAGHPQQHRP